MAFAYNSGRQKHAQHGRQGQKTLPHPADPGHRYRSPHHSTGKSASAPSSHPRMAFRMWGQLLL